MGTAATARVDGRALRYRHRRPELLAAVAEYVLDHGALDWSLRQAADAVGVTHATLLRHFASKDDLLYAVIDKVRRDFLERVEGRIAEQHCDVSAVDQLRLVWAVLREPVERRQFVLLFALVPYRVAEPARFGDLTAAVIGDFLVPLELAFIADGHDKARARQLAIATLAHIRGLHLDLAVTEDLARVDEAMDFYLTLLPAPTASHPQHRAGPYA